MNKCLFYYHISLWTLSSLLHLRRFLLPFMWSAFQNPFNRICMRWEIIWINKTTMMVHRGTFTLWTHRDDGSSISSDICLPYFIVTIPILIRMKPTQMQTKSTKISILCLHLETVSPAALLVDTIYYCWKFQPVLLGTRKSTEFHWNSNNVHLVEFIEYNRLWLDLLG